ncbi:MAG: sigma-54-dependent transcriptional regulator [Spirochaetaceae bacterium]
MEKILVVDDEQNMCKILKIVFEKDGFIVQTASNGESALEILSHSSIDLVIADLKMPDMDGIELLKAVQKSGIHVPFIIISAYGTISSAVEAMKIGAEDFITKPFNKNLIRHRVAGIMQKLENRRGNTRGIPLLEKNSRDRQIIYKSKSMHEVMETIGRIAPVPRPVMLLGESGSGKEMIAGEIHKRFAASRDLPFVSLNCPALPEALFESELFGYKKGAFTGASSNYSGKLKAANGGTLFLDEIAELPMTVQAKLLRFLEDKTYVPLGGTEQIKVDARIVCATNKNLKKLVERGEFRKDLFFRLNTIMIHIPPLRDRKEDIPPLVEYFNLRLSRELNLPSKKFSEEVIKAFTCYPWPGNIRELKNIVERIFLMSDTEEIEEKDIPQEIVSQTENSSADNCSDVIADTEKHMLIEALDSTDWNLTKAARKLGITRSAIRWRINKYKLKGSF